MNIDWYMQVWWMLVAITLAISFAAFIWGMFSGQFSDQQRARYLPFINAAERLEKTPKPGKVPFGAYYLIGILIISALFLLFAIGLTIYNRIAG